METLHNLLSIGTDKLLFKEGSAVRLRQIENARNFKELHIIVFTKKSDNLSEISIAPNCWVYPTNSRSKFLYPFDAIRLGKFIASRRSITHVSCQDPFLTGMAGVALRKRYQVQLEIQLHTDIGSPYFTRTFLNKVYKAMALSYVPKADHIRVVSNRIKKYLVEKIGISNEKIEVRPIVVDVEKIKAAPVTTDLHQKYPQFEKIILMASRLEKEKNIELAIEAFKEVVKKNSKVGLVIVGSGSQTSNLQSLVSNINLDDSVVIEPWAEKDILISYYKTADLFLLTSWYEGYGMTLVEAHAAGCPIVSTDVGVAQEVGAQIVAWTKDNVARGVEGALAV